MPHYVEHDDVFTSSGSFLSTHTSKSSSSRQSLSARKSTASLRGGPGASSLANEFGGGNDGNSAGGSVNGRHHSLAHELAVALMPEPSAGSKLLAEEFGIEFDEGAEGIDEEASLHADQAPDHGQLGSAPDGGLSFADELGAHETFDDSYARGEDLATALGGGGEGGTDAADESLESADLDPVFDSPSASRIKPRQKTPEKDAMDVLSENLEFTDKFLTQLRILDTDHGGSGSSSQQQQQHQPKLERLASDVIRKINESVKDREGQVRALFDCEREFRKISGEVGGGDVLGQLDELEAIEDLTDDPRPATNSSPPQQSHQPRSLKAVAEEEHSNDWELDPDRGHHLGDYEDSEPSLTPIRTTFSSVPPPLTGPPTPAKLVPQLTYVRSLTSATISSLTSISEHSQVNGVATADAGRKIRSLKNKLGTWKTEWESAERSRAKIERWEAGIVDPVDGNESSVPPTPTRMQAMRRVDGRKIVAEQLQAFELALAEAAIKTQAIMAR